MIDIGLTVKNLLREKKITPSHLAEEIMITPQSLHGSLGRKSWRTDQLQKVMEAAHIHSYEIFQDLPPKVYELIQDEPQLVTSSPLASYGQSEEKRLKEKIKAQEKEIQLLQKLLAEKDEVIHLLKNRKF